MASTARRTDPVCRLCGGALELGDDAVRQLHTTCAQRPEARRLGPVGVAVNGPRPFTPAEHSLIRSVHAFMPMADLLAVLNERLVADLGPDVPRHDTEQLQTEIGKQQPRENGGEAWDSLRRLLAGARKSGILKEVTPQTVSDFAVVFRLTPAQVTTLKDVIAHATEETT